MVGAGRSWVVVLAFAVAACGPATVAPSAAPSASGPVAVQITDSTKSELQAVLAAQQDALGKRDLKAYQATYDGQRNALRRCKQESFDTAGRQGASGVVQQISKVEAYGQ